MVVPFYLIYLNFAENIIGFLNQAIAIILFSRLLYCVFFKPRKLKVEKLPSLMLMYMISHWFWCCITIPIQAYMAIMWRPDRNEYNPYLIFWIGFWLNGYMVSNPIQVFFLTLDRCLILTFAETYSDHRRRIIFMKNRIVAVTILAEIFFNVLPGYCSSLFNSISGDNIANYLGQFVGTFLTCDALFCSIIYSMIFLRRTGNTTAVSKISTKPSAASSR